MHNHAHPTGSAGDPPSGASLPEPSLPTGSQGTAGELPTWALSPWFLGALLLLAIALVYSNSLHGAFLYDDYADILDNKNLKHLWPLWDVIGTTTREGWTLNARPLVALTFALNRTLGGPSPFSFHLTNLGIHLAATLALFGAVRGTLSLPRLWAHHGRDAAALSFVIALLWGLHPLQTESVSYITQRYEAIVGLFIFLTFYAVSRLAKTTRPQGWSLLAVLACLLALFSKEVAVALPILVLLYDRAFLAGSFLEALRQRRVLYLGLLLTWSCFLVVQLQIPERGWAGSANHLTWWRYAMSQPGVILHYLRLSFWPHPLCLDYGWPPAQHWRQILPGLLGIGGLMAFSVWALVRRPGLGFLAMCFFLILAPTSSIVPINDLAVEHRMYVPLASVIILGVLGVYHQYSRGLRIGRLMALRPLRLLVLLCVVAIPAGLGILTYLRNEDYKNPVNIWQDAARKSPNNPRASYNYAFHLAERGLNEDAERQYRSVLQKWPTYPVANSGLGMLLGKLGRSGEAIEFFRNALLLEPGEAKHYVNLGAALVNNKSADAAIICLNRAIRLDPSIPEAYNALGLAHQYKGNYPAAQESLQKAVNLNPASVDFRFNHGVLLLLMGNKQAAFREFSFALQANTKGSESVSRLGWILYQYHDYEEGIRMFREGLRIEPTHVKSHVGLAWILATCPDESFRNGPEALRLVEKAMQLDRSRAPKLLDFLAVAQAEAGRFPEACATLREALAKTTTRKEPWVEDLELHLRLFEKGQPFRDSPSLLPAKPPKTSAAR